MSDYLRSAIGNANQSELAKAGQVQNNAGGFVFEVDDWARLRRFLILGSEGGTYYTKERKLTRDNAAVVDRLALLDGERLVREIADISVSGRAPKNDPAILALAIAAKCSDESTRQRAFAALPRVCRTGTHLYHFAAFVDGLGGWGRATRRAIGNWFNDRSVSDLAHQFVKYQQRDGWSARDLLRLTHVKPASPEHAALYRAVCGTENPRDAYKLQTGELHPVMDAARRAGLADATAAQVIPLISEHRLPHEAIATHLLTDPSVWDALLPHLGLTALIRNLATMTRVGLIAPLASCLPDICRRITDQAGLSKARVHPIQLLSALRTYASGKSVHGQSVWTPVQQVVDALDAGFYAAFQAVEPTGKATLLALDVSGSMTCGEISGIPGLTPREASAAMALVTAAREPRYHVMGFGDRLVDVPISAGMRLDQACNVIERIPMGRTDCALPMIWAQRNLKAGAESFAIYTDSETWFGSVHPFQAIKDYRRMSGLAAKLAVVAMTATEFTIADPSDSGMMDFVGFDASAPALMADFFRS